MGGARVSTLVTLRKCTLGHKREIKTLKFVSASTKGFKGGFAWIKPSKKDKAVTFSYSPPSTTLPCAQIASQHTYKSPDSNSPSNNFPSSPDTTDGIRAARSTSPQDTPNASAATRKKKHGTTSRRAPCTEDWTPSQTGTQPTPSHSTPDG